MSQAQPHRKITYAKLRRDKIVCICFLWRMFATKNSSFVVNCFDVVAVFARRDIENAGCGMRRPIPWHSGPHVFDCTGRKGFQRGSFRDTGDDLASRWTLYVVLYSCHTNLDPLWRVQNRVQHSAESVQRVSPRAPHNIPVWHTEISANEHGDNQV